MKKERKINFRVEVYPYQTQHTQSDEQWMRECKEIVAQIERHVDNIGNGRFSQKTSIIWDTEKYCEFCGYAWEEDSDTYNGGCCDEDEKNNPEFIGKREGECVCGHLISGGHGSNGECTHCSCKEIKPATPFEKGVQL